MVITSMVKVIRNILLTLGTLLLLAGCASETEQERNALRNEIQEMQGYKADLEQTIQSLEESSDTERYVIVVEIKQSHFTLDIGEHMKDSMNAIELPLPVDKAFYDSVSEGDVIDDSFRGGSFWVHGSIGSWDIKIVDKYVESN